MTDFAFRKLTEYEKIFKTLVWDVVIKAGETALEAYVPVLALPVIKQLDEAAIGAITDWVFSKLVLVVDIAAIRLTNELHQKAFDEAMVRLKLVSLSKGSDSEEYKKEIENAKIALSKFIRYGATT